MSTAAYPPPNYDRSPGSSFPAPPPVETRNAPRTRVIAFRLANPAVNTRDTISVGPFTGPAILQRVQWWCDNANANAVHALGFGTSLTRITENSVTLGSPKGFEDLIERADKDNYATDLGTVGFWQPNTAPTLAGFRGDVRHIIQKPSFFITITAYGSPGAGNRWTGDLTVIEGVSPDALAAFL